MLYATCINTCTSTHMHAPTAKRFFTAKELAVKSPYECDKSLERNLKAKEPDADHTYAEANPE